MNLLGPFLLGDLTKCKRKCSLWLNLLRVEALLRIWALALFVGLSREVHVYCAGVTVLRQQE